MRMQEASLASFNESGAKPQCKTSFADSKNKIHYLTRPIVAGENL